MKEGLNKLVESLSRNNEPPVELVGPDQHLDPEYAVKKARQMALEHGQAIRTLPSPSPLSDDKRAISDAMFKGIREGTNTD